MMLRNLSTVEAPAVHILIQQSWQLFGTFTFKDHEMSIARRFNMFFAWLIQSAKQFRVYFPANERPQVSNPAQPADLEKPASTRTNETRSRASGIAMPEADCVTRATSRAPAEWEKIGFSSHDAESVQN